MKTADKHDAIKGWCLVARDIVEQGADEARLTIAGVKVRYRKGDGFATVKNTDGEKAELTDEWLDHCGVQVVHEMDPIEAAAMRGLLKIESAEALT